MSAASELLRCDNRPDDRYVSAVMLLFKLKSCTGMRAICVQSTALSDTATIVQPASLTQSRTLNLGLTNNDVTTYLNVNKNAPINKMMSIEINTNVQGKYVILHHPLHLSHASSFTAGDSDSSSSPAMSSPAAWAASVTFLSSLPR